MSALAEAVADAIKDIVYRAMTAGLRRSTTPAVFFTAGSPGAGKSELIKQRLKDFSNILVIDADECRRLLPYYEETNAPLFQRAASNLVEYIYKQATADGLDIIMDSNFASFKHAEFNLSLALDRGYLTAIDYVYLDPALAWTYARQRKRTVPLNVLKHNFMKCRSTIKKVLKDERFMGKVQVTVYYREKDFTQPNKFNVTRIRNIRTEAEFLSSHSCPYTKLAHLDIISV
ncbi:hypothetical protein OI69_03450 [Pectobacterium fontis]|uniref:Zeta toxin domain-containing protein n=1 Tax=Pectobacterium fontis TaxID=2558042 RepID=A0A7V8L689_9GAMM|nr:hypothetical protein OI69_03450 [Pectobacterium fontis]